MVDAPRPVPRPDGDPQRGPQRGPQFARTDTELGGAPGSGGRPAQADGPVGRDVGPIRRVVSADMRNLRDDLGLLRKDWQNFTDIRDYVLDHGPHSYAVTYRSEQGHSQPQRDHMIGTSPELDRMREEGRISRVGVRNDDGTVSKGTGPGISARESIVGFRNPAAEARARAIRVGTYGIAGGLAFHQLLGTGPFAEDAPQPSVPPAAEVVVSAPLVPGVPADARPLSHESREYLSEEKTSDGGSQLIVKAHDLSDLGDETDRVTVFAHTDGGKTGSYEGSFPDGTVAKIDLDDGNDPGKCDVYITPDPQSSDPDDRDFHIHQSGDCS